MPLTKEEKQKLHELKNHNQASGNQGHVNACKIIRSKFKGGESLDELKNAVKYQTQATITKHLTGRCSCSHHADPIEYRNIDFEGGGLIFVTCPECPAKYNHYSSLTDHINTEHNA